MPPPDWATNGWSLRSRLGQQPGGVGGTGRVLRTNSVHCFHPPSVGAHRGPSGASVVSLSNPGHR